MAMTGAGLSEIGNALNHKDVRTTRKVYAHSAHEAERTAREVAQKKMFEKTENKENKVVELDKSRTNSKGRRVLRFQMAQLWCVVDTGAVKGSSFYHGLFKKYDWFV